MIIDKDRVLNNSKVLSALLDEQYENLTLKQFKELETALENCFEIVCRRKK